jgi:NAD-dependent protein deacetylase/lipoamidase
MSSQRVLVVTGAGISAESGIPTFRGAGGYWRNHDPTKLATQSAFDSDPGIVWDWYRERREMIRRAEPNDAHRAVTRLSAGADEFFLLTQNVDDLHLRADWDGYRIPHDHLGQIHGDIFVTKCERGDFSRTANDEDRDGVPRCPRCGARMRPGVVWFGEGLDPRQVARVDNFVRARPCSVVIVVGTTIAFDYIVHWTRLAAGRRGRLIEINPDDRFLGALGAEWLKEPAASALPRLVEELTSRALS